MKNVYRFDFGTGEAQNGFIKITENLIFKDNIGYGITKKTSSTVRKKGNNVLMRDFLDFNENIFKVKLDNGRYRVRIYTGDPEDIGDVMVYFYINGTEQGFWIHEEELHIREITVDVTDGILEVMWKKEQTYCFECVGNNTGNTASGAKR